MFMVAYFDMRQFGQYIQRVLRTEMPVNQLEFHKAIWLLMGDARLLALPHRKSGFAIESIEIFGLDGVDTYLNSFR